MKKIFTLIVALFATISVFPQISITDGSTTDWDNLPKEYVYETTCAEGSSLDALKSVKVFADLSCINLLVEWDPTIITDLSSVPFHIYLNVDPGAETGGYGDQWLEPYDIDILMEGFFYTENEACAYEPWVFAYAGAYNTNEWNWTEVTTSMCCFSQHIGTNQMEIKILREMIPAAWTDAFTIAFDIQQSWNSVGVLPNAPVDETGYIVKAEKMYVNIANIADETIAIFSVDGMRYMVDGENSVIAITILDNTITSFSIPEAVTYNGITYTVTSIGSSAFRGCSSLTSIIIPNSVTSIGDYAFSSCSSLTSITIPNSVTSIGDGVFSSCSSLNSPIYNAHCFAYMPTSFEGTYIIPEGIKQIVGGAFHNCSSLTSITIPNSVTSVGSEAFLGCTFTKDNFINHSTLDAEANNYWGAIVVDEIVDGLFIENNVVIGCRPNVSSITIPNSVTSIGGQAFAWCSALTSITIPNSVTSIEWMAFYSCSSLTSITIPNSVTSIGNNAFSSCSSLTSVTIGNSVTSIGDYAFSSCSSLTSITIPNSVTSIGDGAFSSCSSLTSITIPNSVTSIGNWAFSSCSSLTSIIVEAATPPSLYAYYTFPENLKLIYIPDNTLSAYQQAWGDGYTYIHNGNTLTIHVDFPGTLEELIFDAGANPEMVARLILTGTLNDDDFTYMRETMTSLVDVDLSGITNTNGVHFENKSKLLKIILPNNLTSIEWYAFSSCSSLTSITIPNSVTSIGYGAFRYCSSLNSITIPISVTSIEDNAFSSCYALSLVTLTAPSVEAFCNGQGNKLLCYAGCYASRKIAINGEIITSITIPNSVTSVEDYAFSSCSSLTSITIPNNVMSIGEGAFEGCSSLNSIRVEATIPPNLGTNVFSVSVSICYIPCGATYAYELTDWGYYVDAFVELGCDICGDNLVWEYNDSQLSIAGYGDMYDYDIEPQPWQEYRNKITQISLPNGMTSVGASAFAECKYLNSVTIPSTVKKIHDSAFEDCRSLESVTFAGTALREIGDWAFYNCHSLKDITIPEGVTSIGKAAFFDCSHLNELTLPSTVQTIEDNAFGQCAQVKKMNVKAAVPPVVESETFEDIDRSIPVLVPQGTLKLYREAPYWQEFFNIAESEVMAGVENTMKPSTMTNCQKIIRDGNLVIIRDGVEYNVMGQQL